MALGSLSFPTAQGGTGGFFLRSYSSPTRHPLSVGLGIVREVGPGEDVI